MRERTSASHACGSTPFILMRGMFGAGTPREAANVGFAFPFVIQAADTVAFVILAASDADTAAGLGVDFVPCEHRRGCSFNVGGCSCKINIS